MSGRLAILWLVAAGFVACAAPRDDMSQARRSLGQGDLVQTIVHLDRVPPADPCYAEARSLAQAVERRMRTGQRMFSRGLTLRAEWRDEDAIEAFELAKQVWPCIDGVDEMIEATRRRIDSLQPSAEVDIATLPESAVATTEPVAVGLQSTDSDIDVLVIPQVWDEPLLFEEVGEVPSADAIGEPIAAAPRGSEPDSGISSEQLRQIQLHKASEDLAEGRLDAALDSLESMYFREPEVAEVRSMLTRVLHQRALLFYGKGQLQAAIDSWGRILQIDPKHAQAREFFQAAETELRSLQAATPI